MNNEASYFLVESANGFKAAPQHRRDLDVRQICRQPPVYDEIACRQLGKKNKLSPPLQIGSVFFRAWVGNLYKAKTLLRNKLDVFEDIFISLSKDIQHVRHMLLQWR